ncbi:MAG: response regulator [Treponema sp.]|nr:response regulator [Treponema sp.]
MKKVFIVDDNSINLLTAEETLSDQYEVYTLKSAEFMFEYLESVLPDLILLDIQMPDIDGFEALKRLKNNERYTEIPVIFLTSKSDPATEALGFEMGVIDFISKPFSAPVLLNRIKSHLHIESIIRQRTNKLIKLQNSLVSVLANMIENRDKLTGRHIERTTEYMKILLNAMMERGIYIDEINKWNLDTVISPPGLQDENEIVTLKEKDPDSFEVAVLSSRLHDIGKIAITDIILNKPGSLTADEYETMKTHALEGERIIDGIIAESGDGIFLQNAKLFAGSHHERWDGTGYPRGLSGSDIPLQGRIMAIVDVYDALISDRSYKKAFMHEKAVEIIKEGRESNFDPQIVDVFLEIQNKISKVGL